ncbi:glycoside hydrolase family 88 protein [Globicatella sp. PHS-GS-PNBC-21-1553]|uniref:glycoside hydrolase family 88 protein n=1 Tax=Globicatella sp. PHS-GS-PNBC-21-1553 TaxID=2885764 RepID=UPI00298ED3DD|nr:glycoside hydrolase family 88 protein [Globicatella sp. PHS-GS-PNBC-21-1553]
MILNEKWEWLNESMAFVLEKIRKNQSKFFDKIPWAASKDLKYPVEENDYWTASFWIGQLFLVKEYFNSNEFDMVIKKQLETFDNRLKNKVELETHDIGFLYILSAIADYKINGTESSKKMAIDAADALMIRFNEKAGIIQAWGKLDDLDEGGRMIIDCLMNLPLLYFATEMTGDDRYRKAANRHAKQTQKYIVRENATTFHTYFFDRRTGEGIKGETAQGFSDDSCWARGQAWGIYGFTLSYLYTGDYSYLETAQLLADYFISQLPSDNVCYWDLVFNDGSHEERDSSAAAIAASGLLELAKQLPLSNNRRQQYEEKAVQIAKSLSQNYITKDNEEADGLLLHAVYDKNSNKGVDESVIWGDYFYVETLVRLGREWNKYW